MFSSLAERDFRRLFTGSVFSQFGFWMLFVGQGWLIFKELGGSAFQLGLVSFIQGSISLPVSLLGGGLADRFDRKRLAAGATSVGAATSLVLAVLVLSERVELWHLYITAMALGLFVGIEQPSRQVLVYDTAGEGNIGNAVAVMALGQNVARISGPTLGGALIGFTGVSTLYLLQAVCFSIAAMLTLTLHAQKRVRSVGEPLILSIRRGLGYVRRTPVVRALLLMALFPPFLVYPYLQFFPVFVTEELGRGARELGLMLAAIGFGSIFGSLYIAWSTHHRGRGLVFVWSTMVYLGLVFLFTFQRQYWPAFGILVLAGVANAMYNALANSLIQHTVEDQYRGRAMSLYIMTFATIPFGALLMGLAVTGYGTPATFAAFTVASAVLCGVVILSSPQMRRL